MDGYNKLAAVIGRHQGLSMYSRFPVLNAKSLLWMQAELIHLEQQLKNIAIEDSRSGNEGREKYQYSLLHLKCSSGKDGQDRQWRLILEIRIKLKEYNEALLQHSQIQKLEAPDKTNLKSLQNWLDLADGGNGFLEGREARPWMPENVKDLVALSSEYSEKDHLTGWLSSSLTPFVHRWWGQRNKAPDEETGLFEYSHSRITSTTNVISVMVSSLLPMASIFALYFINNSGARLGAITAFTVIFSMTLALIAKTKRIETFVATTGFAAVQVVFVSATQNGRN